MNGLFPAVLTSCAMAITEKKFKVRSMLYLICKDECLTDRPPVKKVKMKEDNYKEWVEKIVSKIERLSGNEQIYEEANDKPPMLEEFNKKVFMLIQDAMDDNKLSQMPLKWNAWF